MLQVHQLDRIFGALSAGFKTLQLSNGQLVHALRGLSIRFSKDGLFQARRLCSFDPNQHLIQPTPTEPCLDVLLGII